MNPEPRSYVFPTRNLKRYRFPTHINELVLDRADAQCSEVFFVIVPVSQGAPLHQHDDTEQVFYLLEGRGTLVAGNDSFPVEPGDVVRIPMKTLHTIRADKGEPVKYLCVDCFGTRTAGDEPTWDAHVRAMCRRNRWNYDAVVAVNSRKPSQE
jgi:mannose-6-phosphate isomerase-like protein (cupin superfamily)